MIVDLSPLLGQVLRLGHRVHHFSTQLFPSELGVERFGEPVLPRRARIDERGVHPSGSAP